MKESGKTYRIELEPVGRRTEIKAGSSLLEAAQNAGVDLLSICGGVGTCYGCRVRLASGKLSAPTLEEEAGLEGEDLALGYRLACQAIPLGDVKIDIPPESLTTPQRLQVEGQAIEIDLDPPVMAVDINIPPPAIDDLRSDITRLKTVFHDRGLSEPTIKFPLLTTFSESLRAMSWKARLAVRENEIINLLPVDKDSLTSHLYGLAVDIGTTKLAAYLVDLTTGETVAKTGAMNPQIGYGEDVVSRILYCNEHADGRKVLQARVVDSINQMAKGLCDEIKITPQHIVEAVVVGNTAMHHLFAGFPVHQLGTSPYVPSVSDPFELRAHDIGLNLAPGAYVYLPPNIAGYVGADHVAMILATGIGSTDRTALALDIGTNTEIGLAYKGRILCCSCASGPAFEGAHIQDGMRAAPGAIERVQIIDGGIRTHTIGNRPPVGICGSGILDAVSELIANGAIDSRGNLLSQHPLVRTNNGKRDVQLTPAEKTGHGREIVVNRQDINEIQLAKGAIRTGIEILLEDAGIKPENLEQFIIAGAFGTYLDLNSAIRVGMFPSLPMGRYQQVGNAAGTGARQMLMSNRLRRKAVEISQRVEYVELTTHPSFNDQFMKAIMF